MRITIDVKGAEEVRQSLERIPEEAAAKGIQLGSEYLLTKLNAYYHSAPYNYLSWEQAGGFFSDRQRRFVMAGIRNGNINIPYARTGGDPYDLEGAGKDTRIVSNRESMFWSMSPQGQTRMQAMRGWYTVAVWLKNEAGMIVRQFAQGVAEALIEIFGRSAS